MIRRELVHLIRAIAGVTDEKLIVAVGSQAALVQHGKLPPRMARSAELDVYILDAPEKSDLIDGTLGEDSPFHRTFGFYAQGVSPTTALLPPDWQGRAFRLKNPGTGGATVIAPELHDLCASKLVALREKDIEYFREAVRHGLVDPRVVADRIEAIAVASPEARMRAAALARNEAAPRVSR